MMKMFVKSSFTWATSVRSWQWILSVQSLSASSSSTATAALNLLMSLYSRSSSVAGLAVVSSLLSGAGGQISQVRDTITFSMSTSVEFSMATTTSFSTTKMALGGAMARKKVTR